MNGKNNILNLLNEVVSKTKADNVRAVFIGRNYGLTRFANSHIHQNIAKQNTEITFQVAIGKRVGITSTNIFEKNAMLKSLDRALEIAERSKPNRYFPGNVKRSNPKTIKTYFDTTAKMTPAKRAAIVKSICKKADKNRFIASGALSTSVSEIAVVNSNGVALYQPLTSVANNIVISSKNSSGFAQGVARDIKKIDFKLLADRALGKCRDSRKPIALEPGHYDVLLEPTATANLLEWMLYIGLGSTAYHEKTSFLSGKTGKKIMSSGVNIYDDGLDKSGVAFPFDFEGVPKRKVNFVKNGVAGKPVYDLQAAFRYKCKSTGHGLLPGEDPGGIPLNLFMASGKKPIKSIMKNIKRGILVTRFHYINGLLDTPKALMTGMTRDGTFLIEDGKLVTGIKNLRFTDSMVRAFSNIQAISRERELVESWWSDIGCVSAPAVHIKDFNFSGKTEF